MTEVYAIFRKEIHLYFSSVIAYLSMAVFYVVVGLNIWFFPGNIFETGYATLSPFFGLAPWVLIFLVPALTMRLLSEEYNMGTMEVLITSPVSEMGIIAGKYLAAVLLWWLMLLPTLVYLACILSLDLSGAPADAGAMAGSYIGLFLLGCAFLAVGLFSSSVSGNQVTAFLVGVLCCYFLYDAFYQMSQLELFTGRWDYLIQLPGMGAHYEALSRGVVDTRDLVYFVTVTAFFLLLAKIFMERRKWN